MKRLLLFILIIVSFGELLAQPGGPGGGGPGGGGPPDDCWPPSVDCPVPLDNELIVLLVIGFLYASYFYVNKKKGSIA